MDFTEFYSIYIPALEEALMNDNKNYGFYVKSPEDFLDIEDVKKVEDFLTNNEDSFLEMVAYYFDAKSHYFSSIQGIEIQDYKRIVTNKIEEIKNRLKIDKK